MLVKGGWAAREIDNTVYMWADCLENMWAPRRLTTLWASTACYRNSFTFLAFTKFLLSCNSLYQYSSHTRVREISRESVVLCLPDCWSEDGMHLDGAATGHQPYRHRFSWFSSVFKFLLRASHTAFPRPNLNSSKCRFLAVEALVYLSF
jgi:hypothetical protein